MTVKGIQPLENNHYAITVSGEDGQTFEVTLDLHPEGIDNPDLWRTVLERKSRFLLLEQGADVDVLASQELFKDCLSRPVIQEYLIGKDSPWNSWSGMEESGISSAAEKINSWNVKVVNPDEGTADSGHYEELIAGSSPTKEKTIQSGEGKPNSQESNHSGILKWLILLGIVAVLGFGAWQLSGGTSDRVPNKESESRLSTEQKEMLNTMLGFWDTCVKIDGGPPQTLKEILTPEEYDLMSTDYRLTVEELVKQHLSGEVPPIGKAVRYLLENSSRLEALCNCEILIDCPG